MQRPIRRAALAFQGATSLLILGMASGCGGPSESEHPSAPDAASIQVSETPMEFGQVRIGEIDWYVDYAVALEAARTRDLPLWVHFGEHPG